MPPPMPSPLLLRSSISTIKPVSQALRPCLRCFPSILPPLLSRSYSSPASTLSTRHPPSASCPRQSPQNHRNRITPSGHSPSPSQEGLSLKTKSIILAIAIAVIAASGALIGASLRQEIQRSTKQGSTLFSKVGSVQVVGAEALTATAEGSSISTYRDASGGKADGDIQAFASGRAASTSPSVEGRETAAGAEGKNSDITAQIKVLEARKAALVQQRLMTEKKIEGLRQRRIERARKEEESKEDQTKGISGEGR